MLIYLDIARHWTRGETPDSPSKFGLSRLRDALSRAGIRTSIVRREAYTGDEDVRAIVATSAAFTIATALGAEQYQIRVRGKVIYVNAGGEAGLMYAFLELAEIIRLEGYDKITDRDAAPFLEKRGVKFNWPYEPFAEGDPFEKNRETVLSVEFWRDYIDFLAENRYNLLTLWSMNPFEMMFRVPKYPDATPYSDIELERFRQVFDFIFTHAKNRGIQTYFITWNLRLTPAMARGLGLPEQAAAYTDNKMRQALRQHEPLIRDYFREAIKTLVRTYPTLSGLGTSNSEELVGNAWQTEEWVADTYLKAIQELGIELPFIHRTNMSNGKVAQEMFLENYPGKDKLISWKYSNAHMYSHPHPQFESIMGAWEEMDVTKSKVIFTVRNDDFMTLRGADPDFVAEYIRGMKRGYVVGFYWGADGYVWARDFQHHEHVHMDWKYDFERHFLQFETLGRLGYDPELGREHFVRVCAEKYGEACAEPILSGLECGARTVEALTRLHWVNYDYQWYPEGLVNSFGFQSVRNFLHTPSMPGSGTVGVMDTAKLMLEGKAEEAEDARTTIRLISGYAEKLGECERVLDEAIEPEYRAGDLACVLEDIRAWKYYAKYLAKKIEASLSLALFVLGRDEGEKEKAVSLLTAAVEDWQALSAVWAGHYMPYQMGRVNQVFGYPYFLEDVRRDIVLAKTMQRGETSEQAILAEGGFKSPGWARDYGEE
ncbi:MAG: hypothetical protein II727_09090 [Oscillospiraceae bacterium]|nr:hypothetical protein [Oscillospiraceae bacterium]